MKILDVGIIIGIILVELLALSFSASMMALTTFLAWDIVLHPILGLPALTFGQIFLCAWAFLFCAACYSQVSFYFEVAAKVMKELEEVKEDEDDKKH